MLPLPYGLVMVLRFVASLPTINVRTTAATTIPSATAAANALEDTMRMVFGSPNANAFNMWGFWTGAIWNQATFGALVDADWNLTTVGGRYEQLMSEWNTDVTHAVDFACRVAGRGFTEAEWSAQFGSRPYQETCPRG